MDNYLRLQTGTIAAVITRLDEMKILPESVREKSDKFDLNKVAIGGFDRILAPDFSIEEPDRTELCAILVSMSQEVASAISASPSSSTGCVIKGWDNIVDALAGTRPA